MHAIATMAGKLRAKPGAYGLVTANGWYLTKQSTGIYSTRRPKAPFERQDPKLLQAEIDALAHPTVTETPQGAARIETYTVVHRREGPFMGIVIGRDDADRRFVAITPNDPATLAGLEQGEQVGRTGRVGPGPDGQTNLFTPD
jgi:acetyl-CoA C-acetyltransferase